MPQQASPIEAGDIFWVDRCVFLFTCRNCGKRFEHTFPERAPVKCTNCGHEENIDTTLRMRRPHVVIQENSYNHLLPTVLCVPLTSGSAPALRPEGCVILQPSAANNLRQPSYAVVRHTLTLNKCQLFEENRMGSLEPQALDEIRKKLRQLTS